MKKLMLLLILALGFFLVPSSADTLHTAARVLNGENVSAFGNASYLLLKEADDASDFVIKLNDFSKPILSLAENSNDEVAMETAKNAIEAFSHSIDDLDSAEVSMKPITKLIESGDAEAYEAFYRIFEDNVSHARPKELARVISNVSRHYPSLDLTDLMKKIGVLYKDKVPGISYNSYSDYIESIPGGGVDIKNGKWYAGLLSMLKSNKIALKGFIYEIEVASKLKTAGYKVVFMGRRFKVSAKNYSDIDIIVEKDGFLTLIQCKSTTETLVESSGKFASNLQKQIGSITPNVTSDALPTEIGRKIRFVVPDDVPEEELRKLGAKFVEAASGNSAPLNGAKLGELCDRIREGLGMPETGLRELSIAEVKKFFLENVALPNGL